jgi:serine/threonine-protein kinase
MGEVYEGEHLALGRLVAIKVVHPEVASDRGAVARLEHEARVAAMVAHPNVCEVFDIGRLEDGSPFVVMERLQGRTLADRMAGGVLVPWSELRDVSMQVLSALSVAHDKGVIHRDLKPENVFLSERAGIGPLAKVLDFGIAKAAGFDDPALSVTGAGAVVGTPYYMSPEQARGDRALDGRVDLWAVGVMLYEAVTGRRPFDAKNYNALLVQILTARHVPVRSLRPDAPPGLAELIDKALSKACDDRPRTGLELVAALRRVDAAAQARVGAIAVAGSTNGAFMRSEETVVLSEPFKLGVGAMRAKWPPSDDDPEATIVDEPSFLDDSVTMVRPEGGFPMRPRKT